MPHDLIQYAFVSGEISPKLLGRTDLEKYDLGVSLAHNWFVDYRGGLSTRPGQIFCDYVKDRASPVRLFPFQFAPDEANNYVLMIGNGYCRFIQDGGYVLEDPAKIGEVSTVSPWINSPSHGFKTGDWLKVGNAGYNTGRTVEVYVAETNRFQVRSVPFNAPWPEVPFSSTTVVFSRIYTVKTPWLGDDVKGISVSQVRDLVRVTSLTYPVHSIRRFDHTDWRVEEEVLGNTFPRPSNLLGKGSRDGGETYLFAVTALMEDGEETLPAYKVTRGFNNISDQQRSDYDLTYTWDGVAGARSYNIYRGNLNWNSTVDLGASVGFLAKTMSTKLKELNGVPDFTRTPPIGRNPFAAGGIEHISVLTGGSGYTNDSVVTVTGTGTGFIGYPIVADGVLSGIRIINGGQGYTAGATVTVSNPGSGATFDITTTPLTGTFPAISGRFQQRQIYAASLNDPMTVWASRPAKSSNFDESEAVADNDPYQLEIDSDQVAPIKHMVSTRSGLLLMTSAGIWQLSGGSDTAVTATNALASPHTYTGISDLQPIRVDTDIIYVDAKGASVKLLTYNEYARSYSSEDISLLSNHFFTLDNQLRSWTYGEAPFRTVWGVREDGSMLALALVKEQKVFAWTKHATQGYYREVSGVQEGARDSIYFLVDRFINGEWVTTLEQQAPRSPVYAEDAWAVDCGLSLGGSYVMYELTVHAITGSNVRVEASGAVFSQTIVGDVIRGGGGKMRVISVESSTEAHVEILRPIDNFIPEDPNQRPQTFPVGGWSLDRPTRTLGGLWHLEGETVSILADGNVMPPRVVVNGMITLDAAATRVVVGLGYQCVAKILPPTASDAVIEHRRKSVSAVSIRVSDSRGLKAGCSLDRLYEIKERTNELYGEPVELRSGFENVSVGGSYNPDSPVYLVQDYPLPATVLTIVNAVEVGDDPE